MGHAPEWLTDLAGKAANVRITCRHCGFEEDWVPSTLARHIASIGGGTTWSEITRHLRCRSFGCGSTDVRASAVAEDQRAANMPRRVGRFDAHLLGAALAVLDAAARRSLGRAVATIEVRLALLVVHRYVRDRDCVGKFWSRASADNRTADEGLAELLQVIRQRLVTAGWLAPAVLIEPVKTWPWDSPAPSGWIEQGEVRGTGDE